jgi:copper transport protein
VRWRLRGGLAAVAAAAVLAVTAAPALAHAVLLRTSPVASGTLTSSPARVALTFDEPIEPRFAIVSVTDAGGRQQADGSPRNAPGDATTVEVPVRHLAQGWYLVYWRVVSADGHPVRGAFTYAVGPNPGPAPQFVIPSLNETSVTTQLVTARWAAFLTGMTALGLLVFTAMIARPGAAAAPAAARRCVQAFALAGLLALVCIPLYVELATAQFALRPALDLGNVLPLVRDSPLGRAWLDLELVMALVLVAGLITFRIDRPQRGQRSVASLLALAGAMLAAGSAALVPGLAGHAAQTHPLGVSLPADWVHISAVSIWLGGLVGLTVLAAATPAGGRLAVLGRVVPRFSRTALVSVLLIIASGTAAAILHLPTLGSLWQTSYGRTIIAKVALLCLALALGAINFTRSAPRLGAALRDADEQLGTRAAGTLRRLVGGEVAIVAGIVLASAILTSLPPPARALAEVGEASAHIGPGAVRRLAVSHGPYRLVIAIAPNRAARPSTYTVRLTRSGQPVVGATLIAHFAMLDMEMGTQAYLLKSEGAGSYVLTSPALVMVGHWGLGFEVDPPDRGQPFTVIVIDHAEG